MTCACSCLLESPPPYPGEHRLEASVPALRRQLIADRRFDLARLPDRRPRHHTAVMRRQAREQVGRRTARSDEAPEQPEEMDVGNGVVVQDPRTSAELAFGDGPYLLGALEALAPRRV